MFPIGSLADTDHTTTKQGSLEDKVGELQVVAYQPHYDGKVNARRHKKNSSPAFLRVSKVSRQQPDQTGAHIYGLVLGRC